VRGLLMSQFGVAQLGLERGRVQLGLGLQVGVFELLLQDQGQPSQQLPVAHFKLRFLQPLASFGVTRRAEQFGPSHLGKQDLVRVGVHDADEVVSVQRVLARLQQRVH
jgi:hypothetical protein